MASIPSNGAQPGSVPPDLNGASGAEYWEHFYATRTPAERAALDELAELDREEHEPARPSQPGK